MFHKFLLRTGVAQGIKFYQAYSRLPVLITSEKEQETGKLGNKMEGDKGLKAQKTKKSS